MILSALPLAFELAYQKNDSTVTAYIFNFMLERAVIPSIAASELKREKGIGEGSFGKVYQGNFQNKEVAIKELKDSSHAIEVDMFKNEAKYMCSFKSPYIIKCYGACFDTKPYSIAIEYMSKGQLSSSSTGWKSA